MRKFICYTLIIANCIFATPAFADTVFTDVDSAHYAYEAIKSMKSDGIISGYEDGSYKPENPISRAEMATVLCRMAPDGTSSEAVEFTDVPQTHWASEYISAAARRKIIAGSGDGLFRPDDNVTFEEAVKMTVMATGKGSNITPYKTDWSKAYLEIAESTGITAGIKEKKGTPATRADVAVMINNAGRIVNEPYILYSSPMYNTDQNIPLNMSFALNQKIFSGDNAMYSKDLAKASLLLSMTSYSYIYTDSLKKGNLSNVLQDMGFKDIRTVNLESCFSDNNITEFTLARKSILHGGETTDLIVVVIRGTNGTLKEWTSNFDIGSGEEDSSYSTINHKGYDITSGRVIEEIEKYTSLYHSENASPVMWITGHSRGGSIANLCAASLSDKGNKCFSYTFGASKTTVNPNANDYKFIFNIVNSDDLVTYLPVQEWGFTTYGKTAQKSVGNELYADWNLATGLKRYNYTKNIPTIVSVIASCAPNRKSCYEYPENGELYVEVKTREEGEKYIEKLKQTLAPASLPYATFTVDVSQGNTTCPYRVKIEAQPAFLMHNIASVLANKTSELSFVTMPLPPYLRATQVAVVSAYAGGIIHPHTPETYYVLVNSIKSEDFK